MNSSHNLIYVMSDTGDLIRTCELQISDQIRGAWKSMLTVSGLDRPLFDTATDVQLLHHSPHPLAVDRQLLRGAPPLRGESSGAVSRELCREMMDGLAPLTLVSFPRLIVEAAAGDGQQVAEQVDRVLAPEQLDHLPFRFEGRLKSCEALFAASSSIVSRPTIRSSSASRFCSVVDSRSCAKTRSA